MKNPFEGMLRGTPIWVNCGDIAADVAINTKADVSNKRGVFLETVGDKHVRIINANDKIAVKHFSLISVFNI